MAILYINSTLLNGEEVLLVLLGCFGSIAEGGDYGKK